MDGFDLIEGEQWHGTPVRHLLQVDQGARGRGLFPDQGYERDELRRAFDLGDGLGE
jgi:hypothetical protein